MTMWRAVALLLFVLVVGAATVAFIAPAEWAAIGLRAASRGHADLAEASGTLWHGQATLVLRAGPDADAVRASLPERLSWDLSPWPLLAGVVDLTLSHPSALEQPLRVRIDARDRKVSLSGDKLRLPASLLVGLGAPFNTIRPGGRIEIDWQRLDIAAGHVNGQIGAHWAYASSALTPVSPMGEYQLDTNGVFPGTTLTLHTVAGPLELKGSGTIGEGGRLRFQGVARALPGTDAAVKTQLTGLISLLGRRDGDDAILNFGS
ncbi:MAG TPA: type II secretion system protein N [Burkholderiaceae bacterium]|nr:type II secretion system protein N [Burkholderiaceae bacterium]